MSQENRELILTYDLLLTIIRSLKEYKKQVDSRRGRNPDEELENLILLIKSSKNESIISIVSSDINSILSEEDKNIKYKKMEILIIKIKACIYDMKEGMEVCDVIENNLKS